MGCTMVFQTRTPGNQIDDGRRCKDAGSRQDNLAHDTWRRRVVTYMYHRVRLTEKGLHLLFVGHPSWCSSD